MENKKYYNCPNCRISYVEEKDELCVICKKPFLIRERFVIQYHFTAICLSCNAKLDSNFNKVCFVCKKLICNCGECGCIY